MENSLAQQSELPEKPETIEELYPELSPEQQREAEYFLNRYLDLIRRIYERIEREKQQEAE